MIKVGINENLVIKEVKKNDKGSIEITFQEATVVDPMAALNSSGSTNLNQAEHKVIIFPVNPNDAEGNMDSYKNLMAKIAEVKDPLDHILQQYMTKSSIKWDIFAGTGLTAETIQEEIRREATLIKIYTNIVDQFIAMATQADAMKGTPVRVLFIRQSKAKHYPRLRSRYLDRQPFIEPMSISKEQSKLAFSDYELKNGLDKGDAITNAQAPSASEASAADVLFAR